MSIITVMSNDDFNRKATITAIETYVQDFFSGWMQMCKKFSSQEQFLKKEKKMSM